MITTAKRIEHVDEYYFSKKLAEVRALDTAERRVINLGIGSPDQAPSPDTLDALIAAANNPANHGYQSYKGIPALRKAIAEFYHETYNANLNPESEILPLMGSKEGIMHIAMAFVNEGEEILVPNPGYPTYSSVGNLVGARIRYYDLREDLGWRIDIEALKQSDLSNVKLMWINSPHMPTGTRASHDELSQLIDLARTNGFLIVNDNPYSMILNDHPESILSIEGARDVALELNSLSKSHNMAGWRIGWVAGKREYIDAIIRVKSNMDSGMFAPVQHAAVQALANKSAWFNALNNVYAERRFLAHNILSELEATWSANQSGLFVWAKAPAYVQDVEKWIDEILYATKVFITPGFIFGDAGKRFIRISLCAPVDSLTEALTRIQRFMKGSKMISQETITV